MPMIADVMSRSDLGFSKLDRIAVGVGPGSFTGTRVGIAAARGLALATGAGLVCFTSLRIIAAAVRESAVMNTGAIAVALEAGRGEIYFEVVGADGGTAGAAVATSVAGAVELLPTGTVTLAGAAANLVAIAAGCRGDLSVVVSEIRWPRAATLARLAFEAPAASEPPLPQYLRPADARPQPGSGLVERRT